MSVKSLSRPSSSSSPAPNGRARSLVSKFHAHFGPRNRNITDFYIEPDDPWKSYFPGDVLRGTVVLTVVRPVRITHLVLCLHGFVKVFKNTTAPGEAPADLGYLGAGRGRRGSEYLGNGLATLFEDELVLCGEGRLKEGIYKFRFEIGFPPYALPTSINFERGTISYMLTSTLTRPTTINPILTCRKRVNFLENIDIATLPAPKPRVVTLEAVSKRTKSKGKGKLIGLETAAEALSRNPSLTGPASSDRDAPPLSPAPSDVSSSSRLSNSSQSFQITTEQATTSNGAASSVTASTSIVDRTITAKIEVLRAGVLPGDTLPVFVTVSHCKQVRSPHGIIVTLYRQGRIDLHPAIPIGVTADGKKPVYEDCYPRSMTGLGGLTFGTSRTSGVFRKDLSQTFAPLIIDPVSMSASVKTSIRVPEDAFPTITRVPGSMMSFRYYVEVVVDLRGKLAAPDRFPRLNMVTSGRNFSPSGQVQNTNETNGGSVSTNWGGHILDTDQIRRTKGVIAVAFEAVLGTRDSLRGQVLGSADGSADGSPTSPNAGHGENGPLTDGIVRDSSWQNDPYYVHHVDPWSANPEQDYAYAKDHQCWNGTYPAEESEWPYTGNPEAQYWQQYPQEDDFTQQHPYPTPTWQNVIAPPQPEELPDEKARLRYAEQMLLPSQPPNGEPASASSSTPNPTHTHTQDTLILPSAPDLPDDDDERVSENLLHHHHHYQHSSPVESSGRSAGPSAPRDFSAGSSETVIPGSSRMTDDAVASTPEPNLEEQVEREEEVVLSPAAAAAVTVRASDDKQELERQRLLMEASAPGANNNTPEAGFGHTAAPLIEAAAPSAPRFFDDEDDDHVAVAGAISRADETLPRYQR